MNRSRLLVEGVTDENFFRGIIEKTELSIEVIPCGSVDKMPNAITEHLNDLSDGVIEHLAIVADADYVNIDKGFSYRWQKFTQLLASAEYEITSPPSEPYLGNIFYHKNGLPPIGLWLMPDHQHDGMLEDLIQQTIHLDEQCQLLATAKHCLQQLPCTLFKPHRHTKATVYTWLAWQKKPGQALVSTINAELIDLHAQPLHAFQTWLRKVFI